LNRGTVTVEDYAHGSKIRLSLGSPSYGKVGRSVQTVSKRGTGTFARALWVGRKYVVLLAYSQWVDRNGCAAGDSYRLCSVDDEHMIRSQFGDLAAERALDTLRVPTVDVVAVAS
jgi:hypothetical protein